MDNYVSVEVELDQQIIQKTNENRLKKWTV